MPVEEQIHGESRAIIAGVEIDGVLYAAEYEVRYSAKFGKTGVAN